MTKRFVSPSAHYQFYQCNIISWPHHQIEFDISVQSVMPQPPPPPPPPPPPHTHTHTPVYVLLLPCFMDSLQSLLSLRLSTFLICVRLQSFYGAFTIRLVGCPPFSFDSSSHVLIYSIQFQRKILTKEKQQRPK